MNNRYSVWLEDVPSENILYPTNFKTGIRFLSKKGADFKNRAIFAFKQAKFPRFPMKPLQVELEAYWRTMRRSDMSNFHKAIGDAIKAAGLIEDDWVLMFWDKAYHYPDEPNRKIPKGKQAFRVTIYESELMA